MARPSDLDHIAGLLQAKASALVRQSSADLEALLDEEFTYINARGEICDRHQYLDRYCSETGLRFLKQETTVVRIVPFEPVVAVVLDCEDEFEFRGERSGGLYRALYMFRKQADRWLWCAGQATEIR